jgi:hypothetical protein
LTFSDDVQLRAGDGGDLRIYHDGSNSFIHGTTGNTQISQNGFGYVSIQGKTGVDGIRANSDESGGGGNVELFHIGSKKFETTSTGAEITGDLTVTSTDAGATENPTLDLYRNSASPADNDVLGHIDFSGEDSAGNKTVYAKINADIIDQTDGTEDGAFDINVVQGGSLSTRVQFRGNSVTRFVNRDLALGQNIDLVFEGATDNANETTLTVTDPTADRTITLPDATGTVALTSDITGGGGLVNIQSFTSSGTYTPHADATKAVVEVQGAGGGGGGADSDTSTQAGVGAGGNAGGYIKSNLIDVSGASYTSTITIGSGGAGGGNADGVAGGNSVYNDGAISLTSVGGAGGIRLQDINSPNSAQASVSASNTVSGHTPISNIGSNSGYNGTIMESSGGDNRATGGSGADSFLGYGGRGGSTQPGTGGYSGGDGVGSGSGGGGAAVQDTLSGGSYPGGDGADGQIIIYEYA